MAPTTQEDWDSFLATCTVMKGEYNHKDPVVLEFLQPFLSELVDAVPSETLGNSKTLSAATSFMSWTVFTGYAYGKLTDGEVGYEDSPERVVEAFLSGFGPEHGKIYFPSPRVKGNLAVITLLVRGCKGYEGR